MPVGPGRDDADWGFPDVAPPEPEGPEVLPGRQAQSRGSALPGTVPHAGHVPSVGAAASAPLPSAGALPRGDASPVPRAPAPDASERVPAPAAPEAPPVVVAGPRVPLVLPAGDHASDPASNPAKDPAADPAPDSASGLVDLPRLDDGRRARAATAPAQVSPLRALAGAGLAVAGVALGIGALLSVSGTQDDSPVLEAQAGPVVEESLTPEDVAPAVEPIDPAGRAVGTGPAATAPAAAPAPVAAAPTAQAATAQAPVAASSVPAPPRPAAVQAAPPAQAGTGTQPRRRAAAGRPSVAVLNNSTRPGLADRASARFARNGWPVALTGNFRGRLRATTVYYEPGQQAAAQRFAGTFRGIDRVLPRPSNIPGPRGLVVVLTRDFPA